MIVDCEPLYRSLYQRLGERANGQALLEPHPLDQKLAALPEVKNDVEKLISRYHSQSYQVEPDDRRRLVLLHRLTGDPRLARLGIDLWASDSGVLGPIEWAEQLREQDLKQTIKLIEKAESAQTVLQLVEKSESCLENFETDLSLGKQLSKVAVERAEQLGEPFPLEQWARQDSLSAAQVWLLEAGSLDSPQRAAWLKPLRAFLQLDDKSQARLKVRRASYHVAQALGQMEEDRKFEAFLKPVKESDSVESLLVNLETALGYQFGSYAVHRDFKERLDDLQKEALQVASRGGGDSEWHQTGSRLASRRVDQGATRA